MRPSLVFSSAILTATLALFVMPACGDGEGEGGNGGTGGAGGTGGQGGQGGVGGQGGGTPGALLGRGQVADHVQWDPGHLRPHE